jgi:hypothetical protein
MRIQKLIAWFLIIAAPAITWSAYVYVSRMIRTFGPAMDYSVLALAVAAGVAGILLLPRTRMPRALVVLLYVAVTVPVMYRGMSASLCALGDCPF